MYLKELDYADTFIWEDICKECNDKLTKGISEALFRLMDEDKEFLKNTWFKNY